MSPEDIKILMCEIPQFDKLDRDELDIITGLLDYRKIPVGSILTEEGEPGESLFYIVKGLVQVKKETMTGEQGVIAQYGKGASVGEMSLVEENSIRCATATAIEKTEILTLTRKNFNYIAENHPKMALKIMQNIASSVCSRLRHLSGQFVDVY